MATITETIVAERVEVEIKRFDAHQIAQHAMMMVSFTLLVLTGLPMKFNTTSIGEWWAGVWGGFNVLRTVHHTAAWLMVFLCLYHLVYIGYSVLIQRKPFPKAMMPNLKDFVKFFQELIYFIGLRKEPPMYDRFNWREKFDYWAIFWGMPVMAGSGFILMFPVLVTKYLPGWVVPVAYSAHSHEAMLALIWIFLVHVFFNHFSPGVFPLNKAIFTGKVYEERYRHEHPLEYERIRSSVAEKPPQETFAEITRID